MMKFTDQLNRSFSLTKIPKRIVSLVPSQTELLCDLGLESRIVGVTKFCVHPHDIISKTLVVGGTKQVHFDKIKALAPDVILCNKEENTVEMVEALEQIAPVHISDINTIEDCLEMISMYGQLFSIEKRAQSLIETIKSKQQEFLLFVNKHPVLKVAYFIWKNPWMVAGNKTFINHLLELNRFENSFAQLNRYPQIYLENPVLQQTHIILLSSEPFPFKKKHAVELGQKMPDSRIMVVDGEMFSWYGSRLMKAFDYFTELRSNLTGLLQK